MLLPSTHKVWLYGSPIDGRKSIDGLVMVIAEQLEALPQSGDIFVFCNRRRDKLKLIYWDCNGFCLFYKRLERERFKMPPVQGTACAMTAQQLRWLLDGLDITRLQGHKRCALDTYY